ncbi:MAG: pyridoxal-phosphate dependent enzyme [Pirellulaceae bacterium]|nr:pyridoxal-phosphate dependent enzyme [Pirellulaceae bacterium]
MSIAQSQHLPLDFQAVLEAGARLKGLVHRTPVFTNSTLNKIAGRELFFKCENLQRAGAFKFRGACNALSLLTADQLSRGVVTHSSGNHAGALALAAKLFKTRAYVVMPENSLAVKRAAVLEYGGEVISCKPTQQDREETAARVQAETDAAMIPPYDDPRIISGQGTAALELCQEFPNLDVVIAPVGGGGLLAGTCLAAVGLSDQIEVIGAEPAAAADAHESLKRGERILLPTSTSIADGLRTNLGEHNWPIIQKYVQRIICISEDEIIATTRLFWERTKLLIEPSSAVAVAAALHHLGSGDSEPQQVGIILSGGNCDLDRLPWS